MIYEQRPIIYEPSALILEHSPISHEPSAMSDISMEHPLKYIIPAS